MQDNKTRIIIIVLIVAAIIFAIGGTALYFTTDLMQSTDKLFLKYISQEIDAAFDIVDISDEEQIIDSLRKSDFSEKTEGTLKYVQQENDEEEVYNLSEKGISKNSEKSSYRNFTATYGDNVLASFDILKQNNMLGFRLANLVQQFVTVENATVSYFVSSLGYNGKYFDETLKQVDIEGLLDFTDTEKQTMLNTYSEVIFADMTKDNFRKEKNAIITLNNKQSINANGYAFKITKNDLDKIIKRILNQAVNDEIILSKLETIDRKITEAGFIEQEGQTLKEIYIAKLNEIASSIEYQGEDSRTITFTVYEQKGKTVRLAISTEQSKYLIDLYRDEGTKLSIKTITQSTKDENEQQTEIQKLYEIGIQGNSKENERTFTYSDLTNNENFELNIQQAQTNEGLSVTTNAGYNSKKINKIELKATTDIRLSADEEIPVNFDETNNILLNNYEGEKVFSILNNLKNRAIASLENSQSIINTKLLNNIILKIDKKQQEEEQQEQNNKEQEKQRFNNKFSLYEGENVEIEYVKKLLNTASKNMTGYQVISGKQIRIFIKEGEQNEEKANEVVTAIEESRNKFNIKLNYNEEGYIETIDISVYEKK